MVIEKKFIFTLFLFVLSVFNSTAHDVYCTSDKSCDSICPDPQIKWKGRTFTIFSQVVTVKFDTVEHNGFMIALDSFVINSVTGLPNGMTWASDCGLDKKCKFFPGTECLVIGGIPEVAGTYTVQINVDGFSSTAGKVDLKVPSFILIISEAALDLSVQAQEVSSFGLCDGSASVIAADGLPPYSYLWNTGETTSSITGKCSNKYSVVVIDSIGLKDSINAYISEPSVTINSYTPSSTTAVDTITGTIDSCIINCEFPVDSAIITSYTLLDSTHAVFYFTIYHYLNGNRVTLSTTYQYNKEGVTRVRLQINCSGTFSKALKTCYIEDEVTIRFADIGTTQVLVGIEEIADEKEFCEIFPNPFSNLLSIVLKEDAEIRITAINGNELYREFLNAGSSTINTSTLPAGFFFISIKGSRYAEIRKMIKN